VRYLTYNDESNDLLIIKKHNSQRSGDACSPLPSALYPSAPSHINK